MPPGTLGLIVVLFFVGLGLWVLGQFPALDATIAKFIRIVLIVVACVAVFYWVVGLLPGSQQLYFPGFSHRS